MDLYLLGAVSWWKSQCIYHALAAMGREGIIICYPDSPYICLGIHDDLEWEIDQPYCAKAGLPLLRRETGGGVVYLDDRQLFYQIVLRKDRQGLPLRRQNFYRQALTPVISVCQQLGMPVEYKEPADLVCHGAKCSGNGAGDIGQGVAFVGNILFDFDCEVMANALKVPDEAYRKLLKQSMQANLCTLADYFEDLPSMDTVIRMLVQAFAQAFGELHEVSVDAALQASASQYHLQLTAPEWLALPGRRPGSRRVKIAEKLYLHHLNLEGNQSLVALVRKGYVEKCYRVNSEKEVLTLPHLNGDPWENIGSNSVLRS